MSERGVAYGALSDYNFTWMLYADMVGKLLVSNAISREQRSQPDCLSVTEDSAVGRGAFCVPGPATATASMGSPVAGFSLADLQLGPSIAWQTYHSMLEGRRVVVRMGFTPRQCRHVNTEARALEALHALQGADVPRLLAHGYTREGFAYVITEYIDRRTWDGSSAADRSLGDQLRAGLTHIHQHGVIQNDVKPDNILVEHATGRLVFIDFALAKYSHDPEEHGSEDSELHAMLRQADAGWPVRQL
ncbi:hypothetical protein WJX84_004609 [Apatococcus fuscideae]|uniref:Protein kinase domain-containing protein n=1 Tax=Apatococcus fuscideae TaxID=2026836 RepID=A0AAW1T811_9CHLO